MLLFKSCLVSIYVIAHWWSQYFSTLKLVSLTWWSQFVWYGLHSNPRFLDRHTFWRSLLWNQAQIMYVLRFCLLCAFRFSFFYFCGLQLLLTSIFCLCSFLCHFFSLLRHLGTQYGQSQSEKKVNTSQLLLPQHQSTYPRGPESASIVIPPFRPKFT